MRRFALAFTITLLAARPAGAALTPRDLAEATMAPAPGAVIPGDLGFFENGRRVTFGEVASGRPTLLALVDYRCRWVCGPLLAVLDGALDRVGLRIGADVDLVVVGLDPQSTAREARAMTEARLGDDIRAAHVLTGDAPTLARLFSVLGLRVRYDAEAQQFAHPTDVAVLTADHRVARLLPGLALDPTELRAATAAARGGAIGEITERIHLLCYGLDPARGLYSGVVRAVLIAAGALTLAALGAGAFWAGRRRAAG